MKQFFETYYVQPSVPLELSIESFSSMRTIVSSVMTQFENGDVRQSILAKVSWTHHLTLMARTKSTEERDFYLHIALQERYSVRELDRQISAGLFERTMLGNQHISSALRETHPSIINTFKDHYVFEFLNLPEPYSERELQKALLRQMKHFILELGQDFLFYAEEYRVQVGKSDFFLDLLFYHRGLQCLVAFELKTGAFQPEHLGKLNFYLEALDRDVKKSHEKPSIGILLCKDKDSEVVEYALSVAFLPQWLRNTQPNFPIKKCCKTNSMNCLKHFRKRDEKDARAAKFLSKCTVQLFPAFA